MFKPIGEQGQKKIVSSSAVLIGCGALGSNIAQLLVRAGVGKLKICDRDYVELENLQRQTLFDEDDVKENLPKAVAAREKLAKINSEVRVEVVVSDVNFENVEELIKGATLVLDGTDNFETRFLLNDACVKHNIPWIYGGAVSSYGMVAVILPNKTPCFRCLVGELPEAGSSPTCDTVGVLNSIVGVISSIQSGEAIKFISGNADALIDGVATIDLWQNSFRIFKAERDHNCKTCVLRDFEFLTTSPSHFTKLCGRNAVQIATKNRAQIDFAALSNKLNSLGKVSCNDFLLKFYIDGYELTIFKDARAIIKGTDDITKAKSLYAKYIGV
ncbi:ThiF family adenylyltransferase [Candidatus Peregrinibacteria bacterium]|nr:ThiF family adenylyltransferase [Candidatus Peregrinibacteria bacterium]